MASIGKAGGQVVGVVPSQWERERDRIAEDAILQKYLQSPERHQTLLGTAVRLMAASYPKDSTWGTGVDLKRTLEGPYQGNKDSGWRKNAKNLLARYASRQHLLLPIASRAKKNSKAKSFYTVPIELMGYLFGGSQLFHVGYYRGYT